jgi:uncharacterized protein YdcH (DUF465 family)
LFENNQVIIKEINKNKYLKLLLKTFINSKEKDFEILLVYNKGNKNIFFNKLNNEYNKLNSEIKRLKEEIEILKKDIEILKSIKLKINDSQEKNDKVNQFNCKNIKYLANIVEDSYSDLWLANTFIIFKSINSIYYLIYINKKNSILSYDMINNKKLNEIKKAHKQSITNLRYYLDIINKRDLFLSISCYENNIKL